MSLLENRQWLRSRGYWAIVLLTSLWMGACLCLITQSRVIGSGVFAGVLFLTLGWDLFSHRDKAKVG